jgi:hypothetical protein
VSLTWSAVYLRGEVPPGFPLPIEGEVEVRTLGEWTELGLRLVDPVPLALAVSRRVRGEVVAVQVQSTATVVSVVHCEGGQEQRRLDFADGSWVAVRGTPRPWERALYRAARLEEALEDCDDEAEVRAAFARADVRQGDSLPWPGLLDNVVQALGVSEGEWDQTRASPPRAVLRGTRTSRLTHGVRAGAVVTLALLAGAVFTSRDARGLFAMFAVMVLSLTALGALLRRVRVGRWIF